MGSSTDSKAAIRVRFANHVSPLVDAGGGVHVVAARLGVWPDTVRNWMAAQAIPYVRNLVRMSELLGWNLDALLEAAGKPPIDELRDATKRDATSTLGALLTAWRTKRGLSTSAAAEHFGISRYEFSRWQAGSHRPESLAKVHVAATGLGVSMDVVLDACMYTNDHELVRAYQVGTDGLAGLIRRMVERADYDSYSPAQVRLVAKKWKIAPHALSAYLAGTKTVSVLDAQRLAATGMVDLSAVLRLGGYNPSLAHALTAARHLEMPEGTTYGEVLRMYRVAAGLSQQQAAERVSRSSHASLSRAESGFAATPYVDTLTELARAVNAPLSEVLAAAGYVLTD